MSLHYLRLHTHSHVDIDYIYDEAVNRVTKSY